MSADLDKTCLDVWRCEIGKPDFKKVATWANKNNNMFESVTGSSLSFTTGESSLHTNSYARFQNETLDDSRDFEEHGPEFKEGMRNPGYHSSFILDDYEKTVDELFLEDVASNTS